MNMKLIDPSDPLYFQQTSDGLYDRHHYKLVYKTGKKEYHKSWESMFTKMVSVTSNGPLTCRGVGHQTKR